jgi:hypothetical protein
MSVLRGGLFNSPFDAVAESGVEEGAPRDVSGSHEAEILQF